jgi:hypothetical protein
MEMKRFAMVLMVVLVVAGGVGYLATQRNADDTSGGTAAAGSVTLPGVPASAVPAQGRELTWEAADQSLKSASTESSGSGGMAGGGSGVGTAPAVGAPPDIFAAPTGGVGPKVIKTSFLTVQVSKGGFEDAWQTAADVASKYRGFIVSSSSSGEKSRSGELLIRVPSASFDQAMGDLRGLGDVEEESVNGQEVTDQFVDLSARLRSWEAQQRVLIRLMDKANSIAETMTVQREIQQVQTQIEQIKGQLRLLRDQTSYGTIQLAMHEPGAVITKSEPEPVETPSLATALARAWAGFLSVLALIIIGLGYLIPVGAVALVVWLVVRRGRVRAVVPS